MISKIVIFDDSENDQQKFKTALQSAGCEALIIEHAQPNEPSTSEKILKFRPQAAIVDSQFANDIDGVDIVKYLNQTMPDIPIIICSVLCDKATSNKWLQKTYRDLPGVRRIIGKIPFPSGNQIIDICNDLLAYQAQ